LLLFVENASSLDHMEILTRFYHMFESIFKYLQDFKLWLHELEEGFFVHLTLDAVLNNAEGKQLVAESVYVLEKPLFAVFSLESLKFLLLL
jgi:hypothetical protein